MDTLSYDRGALHPGAAHIGTGAFHRGHQQSYYDDLARSEAPGWAVRGINLAPPDIARAHKAQEGCYHLLTEDQHGRSLQKIGTLSAVDSAPDPLDPVWDGISFVTLTITEKGYCHRPGSTAFDLDGAIASDLANPGRPQTAPGFLCRMLEHRRQRGFGGLTLASCDNVADNGALLRAVMHAYAAEVFPDLPDWMADHVAFPTSMVDRIVPAMSQASAARLQAAAGAADALGIVAEPFRQWVLEDDFAGVRPALETVGVQIVPDVAVFEHMKHRLLNGLQSALAELGRLTGHATSYEAAADPLLADWSRAFLAQQAETLRRPPGEDLARYARTSLDRLTNPTILHPLNQIASDASFKLPQRILAPAAERLAKGQDATPHAAVVAAWIRLAGDGRTDRFGQVTRDSGAARIAVLRDSADTAEAVAEAVLRLPLFPEILSAHGGFRAAVAGWLGCFQSTPAPGDIARALAESARSLTNA